MNKHQQTAIITHGEGMALATPHLHATLHLNPSPFIQSLRNQEEDRRPETQGSKPLLIGYVIFTVCSCNLSLLLGLLYLFTTCVLFKEENHVNVFALCSRPYRYSWFVSGLAALASCILSFQTTVHYNICLKCLILGEHCITIVIFVYHVRFFRF